MGTNVSKAEGKDYRGLGIQDPRWKAANLNRTDSTITEANPRPGVAQSLGNILGIPGGAAASGSGMVLETSGYMPNMSGGVSGTKVPTLQLTTNKGGMPGMKDARFTFDPPSASAQGTVFGWDSPDALSYARIIDGAGAGNALALGGCLRLQSNKVIVGMDYTTGGTAVVRLRASNFDTTTYANSGASRYAGWDMLYLTSEYTADTRRVIVPGTVCLTQMPEGRVYCYFMVKSTAITGEEWGQVVQYFSDDDGVTWGKSDKYVLRDAIRMSGTFGAADQGFDIKRMRVAHSNGQTMLLIAAAAHNTAIYTPCANVLLQFASSDLGNNFDKIDNDGLSGCYALPAGGNNLPANIDICVGLDGAFLVSYNRVTTAANEIGTPCVKRFGAAYTTWASVSPSVLNASNGGHNTSMGTITGFLLVGTNTTIATDENGIVTLSYMRGVGTVGRSYAAISWDYGTVWADYRAVYSQQVAVGPLPWWDSGDPTFYPANYCSTYQCGRWLIFAPFYVGDGQEQEAAAVDVTKIWCLYLGGYSQVTRPFKTSEEEDTNQIMWDLSWIPGQRIRDTLGWTFAGTGAETLNSTGYTEIVTGGAQTVTIDNATIVAPNAAGEQRFVCLCEFKVTAGTSSLQVLLDSAGNDIHLEFKQSTTNCTVTDLVTAGVLANVASPIAADFNQFLIFVDRTQLRLNVWVRSSIDDTEIRKWTKIVDAAAIVRGAVAAAPRVRVDQPANSTSNWRSIHWGSGPWGLPLFLETAVVAGFVDTVYGRSYSPFPISVFANDGVRVRAVDGPTWDGDRFSIAQRHEYGLENIFPDVSSSPRKTWRSSSETTSIFVVDMDNSNDPAPLLGRVLVIGAFNCNFKELQVSYRTVAAGAWNTVGTLDFSTGQAGLNWIRDGHMIRPNTAAGADAADYFTYNILEDSHVLIEDVNGNIVRTITKNSEGTWSDTTLTRPRLYCADIAATDSTTGIAGAIWSKDGLLIVRDMPDIHSLRFVIPLGAGADSAEGYFEIGTLFVGHLAYFGKQYARARALNWTPNYELNTSRSGTRRAQSFGPSRRSVEFSWANENETDMTQIGASSLSPDYILPATNSTYPVANPADTAWKMAGLVESVLGAATPILYLSKVPMVAAETTDTVQVNRNLFMLGRIVSDPRIETVMGNEWAATAGELARVATVTVEEEV